MSAFDIPVVCFLGSSRFVVLKFNSVFLLFFTSLSLVIKVSVKKHTHRLIVNFVWTSHSENFFFNCVRSVISFSSPRKFSV